MNTHKLLKCKQKHQLLNNCLPLKNICCCETFSDQAHLKSIYSHKHWQTLGHKKGETPLDCWSGSQNNYKIKFPESFFYIYLHSCGKKV